MATRSGSQHPCRRTTDFGSEYSDSERNRHALVGTNDETMIGSEDYKRATKRYLFDRDFLKNTRLLDSLVLPSYLRPTNVEDFESIFIMGTTSSGVSFHKHADGWNGVIFGKKRWFIYPKETTPPGGDWPSFNQQDWLTKVYKHLPPSKLPYECVQEAGEILYVPESFYHATINIGDTVAIAVQRISGQTRAMRLFDKVSNTFFDKNPYSKTSIEKRVNLYNRLADVLPENTEILVKLAETLVLSGYLKRARDLMTKAVSKDEFNARAFVGLARIHAELSAHDDADVAFRRAIEINDESAVVYAEYGLYLVEQGRFEDAKVIYYQASKKWPFEEEFLVGLLKMQEKLGQQELAEITKSILTRVRKINA